MVLEIRQGTTSTKQDLTVYLHLDEDFKNISGIWKMAVVNRNILHLL